VEPKPLQRPHPPVWAAAGSPDSARKAGRLGLRILLSSGVRFERIPQLLDAYREGLKEAGENYSAEHVLLSRVAHIAETRQLAWERAAPYYNWFRRVVAEVSPPPGQATNFNPNPLTPKLDGEVGADADDPGLLFCTPDECSRYIENVATLGVGHVVFQGNWGGIPQEYVEHSLELIGREVIPNFATLAK
jgi:alkanesulfonate monooxygenase SsuD/methylene tetrahydromethanopterin reductase-like flavin-dependent oxidoreductase (luciferase family)